MEEKNTASPFYAVLGIILAAAIGGPFLYALNILLNS